MSIRYTHELPSKMLMLGDSLTQYGYDKGGWVSLLGNHFIRRADIINRGFSGYNSRWCLQLLKEIQMPFNTFDLGFVFLGANDAQVFSEKNPVNQHVAVEEYESNLKEIVKHLSLEQSLKKFILISPPPLNEKAWVEALKEMPLDGKPKETKDYIENLTYSDRQNKVGKTYAEACCKIAKELDADNVTVGFVDLWKCIPETNNENFFSDGLHFSEMGNQKVFEEILAVIKLRFPEYHQEPGQLQGNMPMLGPYWAEFPFTLHKA